MKDNYGDKISVHTETDFGNPVIYLAVTSSHDDSLTDAALTPKKARKLARKLLVHADLLDGEQAEPTDALRARDGFQLSGYLLDLTQEEAETLAVILYKVGGDPRLSPRGHADSIRTKLESLGLNSRALNADPRFATERFAGALHFEGRA